MIPNILQSTIIIFEHATTNKHVMSTIDPDM